MHRSLTVLAAVAAFVGGCAGPDGRLPEAPSPLDCVQAAIGTCDPLGLTLTLHECLDSAMSFPSTKAAFPLPPGYVADQTPLTPQHLQVAYDRCARITVGNFTARDATLGFAGVLVTAPDRGQPGGAGVYVVEVVTDSLPLAGLFRAAGFPVAIASASIQDEGALRQVGVRGEADYDLLIEMDPNEGDEVPFSEVLHGASAWVAVDNRCQYYRFVGTGQFTARSGAFVQAMPEAGPLVGVGSQSIVCTQTLTFGSP